MSSVGRVQSGNRSVQELLTLFFRNTPFLPSMVLNAANNPIVAWSRIYWDSQWKQYLCQRILGGNMKHFRLIYLALTAVLFSACSFQPNPSSPSEPVIEPQANFYRQFGGALDINLVEC